MATLHERVLALERAAPRQDERAVRHDLQLETIRTLLERGVRMVTNLAAENRKLQTSVRELTNSTNGQAKRKIDLQ
jgi:hypothetical protein